MRFTFRQLAVFEAVARHRSYTQAAAELYLTQPAVFTQVRQLEESLGQPLIERIGKQLRLTEAGQEVLTISREMIDAAERLNMRLAELQGLKRGRLRVAMVTTATYLIPRLLAQFCVRHPGIDAALTVSNRENVLARLASNEDDLAVLGAPPEGMDVIATPIADNPLVVIARRDHPLAGEQEIPLARIAEEPFIVREPGSGTRLATERLFKAHRLTLKVRMELGSNEAIKQAIAGGLGVSVLSRHTLVLAGEDGPLLPLDVQGFPLLRKWYVAHLKDKHLSVAARAFIDYLLEARQQEGG